MFELSSDTQGTESNDKFLAWLYTISLLLGNSNKSDTVMWLLVADIDALQVTLDLVGLALYDIVLYVGKSTVIERRNFLDRMSYPC